MGYTTEFYGQITIDPPLDADEIAYLTKFSESRRMLCTQGPYYVDRGGCMGQNSGPEVLDHNRPPAGQPGLWCQWVPTADGTAVEWDGGEKFYDAAEWMAYLMGHFLAPGAYAKSELPFLRGHTCNGRIEAFGEDRDDTWVLIVNNNVVSTARVTARMDPETLQTVLVVPPEPRGIEAKPTGKLIGG